MSAALRRLVPVLSALLLFSGALVAQQPNPNAPFGLPSRARPDPSAREDYLIVRPQYVLGYNAEKHAPNWVCWRLKESDIGTVPRAAFTRDPDLPRGMAKVTSEVYDGCGFDRGHLCPAKDRSATREDQAAVFHMTNILPQSPNCNQKAWERLEDYCRHLAKEGHVLYIACGGAGVGGEGKQGRADEVGKGRLTVAVPAKLWKVVVVLPAADAEPRRNTRVIAVIIPNDQTVGFDWTKYRTTARQVERLTGYRFFRAVPADVAKALRDHRDEVEVSVPGAGEGKDKRGRD
jgi:endonuclease G